MELAIFIASFVAFFALAGMIGTGVDGMWQWFCFWVGILFLCLSIIIPCALVLNEENAARLAQERAVCESAGWLWAHDEEACINEQGWTVDVR